MTLAVDDAADFERERPRLLGLAYRMLGRRSEADDVLQDAYLRWRDRPTELASAAAWLTTVVARLCLDRLKSAQHRREEYVGPWLPEPVRTDDPRDPSDLADVSLALLVSLERLSPRERAVIILHDVFDYGFGEIADIVGETEAGCRQLAHRGRAHVSDARARFAASRDEHRRLLDAFVQTLASGDTAALGRLLADDVQVVSDGGGRIAAATKVVTGIEPAIRLLLGILRKYPALPEPVELNGQPGLLLHRDGGLDSVSWIAVSGGRITAVYGVRNPDKLRHLGVGARTHDGPAA